MSPQAVLTLFQSHAAAMQLEGCSSLVHTLGAGLMWLLDAPEPPVHACLGHMHAIAVSHVLIRRLEVSTAAPGASRSHISPAPKVWTNELQPSSCMAAACD
jgi:hypothetical protein